MLLCVHQIAKPTSTPHQYEMTQATNMVLMISLVMCTQVYSISIDIKISIIYSKSLTNFDIGKYFGYHPNYVNQLIKNATGVSLHRYLLNVKMMNAVSLLENTTMPIGEIAQRCGFCDLAYFSQYFKRHFGIAPSKYR